MAWRLILILSVPFIVLLGCQSQDSRNTQDSESAKSPVETSPKSTGKLGAPQIRPEDWAMFMHDVHFSGKSPDQTLKPPLKPRWKFKTGGPIHASPIIVDGTVYVGSTDGKLYALDAKQWGVKWTFRSGDAIRYAAAVWNNHVYFSSRDNHVYALDAKTGELVWKFKSETWIDSPPIISNGQVYIGAFTRTIHVINGTTGEAEGKRRNRVQIDGIEFGCAQGKLRPIIPEHEAELWRSYVDYTYSFPVRANGVVYIGARDNHIHAIDAASKKKVWSYETRGFVDAAPAVSDGLLFVTSHDGYVYAFKNRTTESPQPDERQVGIVVHDEAPVYPAKDSDSPVKLHLNDGVKLPILNEGGGWYQVELPDGESGWMDEFAIGRFEETDDVQFNTSICSNIRTLELIEGGEYPYWSPDGKAIAFFKRTNLSGQYWKASEIWITDREAKRFRKLCEGRFYNPHLSWSFNGNLLAFEARKEGESEVWTFDLKTARLTNLVSGDAPVWSPVANKLAFRRWEKGFDVVYRINSDTTGLAPIARIPIEGRVGAFSFLDKPSWSPDGERIAIGLDHQHYKSGYARIRLQNVNGTRLGEIRTQHQRVKQINWSADGTELAYVLLGGIRPDRLLDKRLHVTDVNERSRTRILKHTSPSWSPQGKRLAYMEREDCMGLQWKVWILDMETNRKRAVARAAGVLTSITWLPDGKQLCLWHTSEYLRGGEYKPATTRGWVADVAARPERPE